ncbi:hypothetical protein EP073_10520 [Geovibrio thiophilus]|uniref:4-amino-4-deoxychorismate lyase n=1 Tax=Geovibrio thiophilus TaxID=139438 RepID=A0A3R5Y7W0_9BACT|nr:aminotransferase class IV [Geovibrio thiophilus]QAR33824.1 hypothetical protein EP073_10520 [Geovibrio thiophilus]
MIIWKNGELTTADERFGLPAFKYGFGFFESILYNGKKICHLDRHLKRLQGSLEEYGCIFGGIDYEKAINDVIEANSLGGKRAKINIYSFEVNPEGETQTDISAHEYTTDISEYRLNIHDRHQISHLNRHKSMNWAHQFLALKRAIRGGYDNSLLISEENEIFEAASGAVLFRHGNKFVTAPAGNRLPSISLEIAKELLPIEERGIHLWDLEDFENCWFLNSMIGAKPVSCISVFTFEPDHETAAKITAAVCGS